GLVRRRRRKRRVRADGRKKYKQRRARGSVELELIELGEDELIRDCEPAERRTAILQAVAGVDVVEAVEGAFGPGRPDPRQQRNRSIAVSRKGLRQRVAMLGHQQRVRVWIAD